MAITAEGDPQHHLYKVMGKQTTPALITDDYGTEFPPKTAILQDNFYLKENIIDMTYRVGKKIYV